MDTALLQAVHEAKDADALKMTNVFIVAAGAQRIKQFVFESPGLNEIRGASTQLDDCIKGCCTDQVMNGIETSKTITMGSALRPSCCTDRVMNGIETRRYE